ncbi:MAG: cupin domain-containing protein [Spirochaetaceae bacterium]|nr:cupin domain-containing protein [Spirochaetaceae bacterium]
MLKDLQVKGLNRCLAPEGYDGSKLAFHLTEAPSGGRSHAAHVHAGLEMFYIIEGLARIQSGGDFYDLGPNESAVLDGASLHGIENRGDSVLRYLVVIVR